MNKFYIASLEIYQTSSYKENDLHFIPFFQIYSDARSVESETMVIRTGYFRKSLKKCIVYLLWVSKHLFTVIFYGIFVFLLLLFFFKNSLQKENLKPAERAINDSNGFLYDQISRLVFGFICENLSDKIHDFHWTLIKKTGEKPPWFKMENPQLQTDLLSSSDHFNTRKTQFQP